MLSRVVLIREGPQTAAPHSFQGFVARAAQSVMNEPSNSQIAVIRVVVVNK